jgi:hypothetical protein
MTYQESRRKGRFEQNHKRSYKIFWIIFGGQQHTRGEKFTEE